MIKWTMAQSSSLRLTLTPKAMTQSLYISGELPFQKRFPFYPQACLATHEKLLWCMHFPYPKGFNALLMWWLKCSFPKIFRHTVWRTTLLTFVLYNCSCWKVRGFSPVHIHTFCILTWPQKDGGLLFMNKLIQDSTMHIFQQSLAKVNSCYIMLNISILLH
jgi:hypothetical protein